MRREPRSECAVCGSGGREPVDGVRGVRRDVELPCQIERHPGRLRRAHRRGHGRPQGAVPVTPLHLAASHPDEQVARCKARVRRGCRRHGELHEQNRCQSQKTSHGTLLRYRDWGPVCGSELWTVVVLWAHLRGHRSDDPLRSHPLTGRKNSERRRVGNKRIATWSLGGTVGTSSCGHVRLVVRAGAHKNRSRGEAQWPKVTVSRPSERPTPVGTDLSTTNYVGRGLATDIA